MKLLKIFIIGCIVFIFSACVYAADPYEYPTLNSYWSFDEESGLEAEDSAGGHVGYLQEGPGGAPNVSDDKWQPGMIGNAIEFDGTNDLVNTYYNFTRRNIYAWNEKDFSIAFWLKPDTVSGFQGVLGKGRAFTGQTGAYIDWQFQIQNGTLWFDFFDSYPNEYAHISNSGLELSATVEKDVWTHFVVTWRAGSGDQIAYMYKNGDLVDTDDFMPNQWVYYPYPQNSPMLVGFSFVFDFYRYYDYRYYDGMMDELAIWDYMLTSDDVQTLYGYGFVPEPMTVISFLFITLGLAAKRFRK